jgi:hypothetical protein
MVASVPRWRAVVGQPMTAEEMEAQVETAVDIFLAGTSRRPATARRRPRPMR